jgi:demethylmenaquinone methyltransferase/2-methoxy-6-polyprenyl-1,4-benzoquinol methylase
MTSTETKASAKTREGSGAMFDGIAHRYDLVNRVISLGIDQSWRRKTVASLELQAGARVLDLATGTGDLAIMVARTHPDVTVVGVDP